MKQLQNVMSFLLCSMALSIAGQAQYTAVKYTPVSNAPLGNASLSEYSASAGINEISASLADKKIHLEWTIPAYGQAASFIIERSLDGETFELIGSDASAIKNTTKKSFSFTDKPGEKAIRQRDIFYRLGSMDGNNVYHYTKPIMVRVNKKGIVDYITVYPHPTENDIHMIVGLKENGYMVTRLTNDKGQEVLTRKGKVNSGQQQMALTGTNQLKQGNYWLEVIVDSKPALKMKLIKD
ncbi:hypothetical protein [Flavihumibacter fluvii]|uniref:hypothetical protein n=1 Tax=Flavihumibacter fluvii TaxID=2838157 RepID=UPI001BDE2DC1|nr:hypothetical protein [Flavihumibacter fluvii]ULQ52517.1 hypothetical protein KJS93_20725 [Flavihumibacter fluvii]